jgi:hypothetical protein
MSAFLLLERAPFLLRGPLCSSQNSNIVQLFSMLKKDDKSQQMVYYQVRGRLIYVHVTRWFKLSVLRPASGHTRFQRSLRHSGRACRSPSTWLSAITSMHMSWVRRYSHGFMRVYSLTDVGQLPCLTGGYEFLMENCTFVGICLAQMWESHFVHHARSCKR